ncbi:MAG: ATP-binding cassette domain-containing protein [Lachnospiraceae bacterium]|nr:ATP-binding cassette domain-containing protein [Porcincola intestinalis]MCI6768497.1 ATP-binding cassette domain-containing protein [Lachnospiraceae bacterium]MDY4203976.1 ATP-binding cassette domain-containing protein [Porcincola intestinalis]MDY5579055.1 ATP-binding cassette domain-containing protein [Porcincola intestinalis]
MDVKNLSKNFKEQVVFSEVSMRFESGRIYGLIGRNGSGKTVFLKCICGFIHADTGEIWLDDRKLGENMEYLDDCGFLIERPGFMEDLSGRENLKYIASIRKIAGADRIMECMEQVGLDPGDKKHVSKYSMGMKQRLGVAQAIMENPSILILDEPMNGLDDNGVVLMRKLLLGLRNQGKLILISSHYMEDIQLLCDKVYRFRNGCVEPFVFVDSPRHC